MLERGYYTSVYKQERSLCSDVSRTYQLIVSARIEAMAKDEKKESKDKGEKKDKKEKKEKADKTSVDKKEKKPKDSKDSKEKDKCARTTSISILPRSLCPGRSGCIANKCPLRST